MKLKQYKLNRDWRSIGFDIETEKFDGLKRFYRASFNLYNRVVYIEFERKLKKLT